MHIERAILIAFLGNYLINNVVGAVVALLQLGTGGSTAQYVVYIVLAAIMAGVFSWWHLSTAPRAGAFTSGISFGVIAFVVAVATALLSGIAGVLTQSGSLGQLASVLPNFGPFLFNWPTLALLGYWVIPAAIVGYLMQKPGAMTASGNPMPRPMI